MEIKEPAPAYHKKFYSIQEYLEMEKDSLGKNEYYNAEILTWQAQATGIMLYQLTLLFL